MVMASLVSHKSQVLSAKGWNMAILVSKVSQIKVTESLLSQIIVMESLFSQRLLMAIRPVEVQVNTSLRLTLFNISMYRAMPQSVMIFNFCGKTRIH